MEGRCCKEMVGESTGFGWLYTSKSSSSECTTSNTLTASSSCVESEEITSSLGAQLDVFPREVD